MNLIQKNLPNALTCLNILSGCVAILFAFHPQQLFGALPGWQWACVAIGVATAADFLDGFTARLMHAYSELGKQLDSLSDLVSFGVAPAMLLINLLAASPDVPAWLCWLPLVIPVAGAIRLARFNIDTRQTFGFIGLPIPANAIFWIGWAALAKGGATWAATPWLLAAVILLEAWLMVSPIRLFSLKFHNYRWKGNARRWLLIICSAILLAIWGLKALCPIIFIYLILALLPDSDKTDSCR